MNLSTLAVILLSSSGAVLAQSACELGSFQAPGPQAFFEFGSALARSGDTLVVGEPSFNSLLGRAHIYEHVAGDWVHTVTLDRASLPWNPMRFGSTLAIDGDQLAIGAPFHDDSLAVGGAVFVHTRNAGAWTGPELIARPIAEQAYDAFFGRALALDGDTLLVGAYRADAGGNERGAVWVYRRVGPSWIEEARLTPTDARDHQGFGIQVSLVGDRALVGALYDDELGVNAGAAYLFERTGSSWQQVARLESPAPVANGYFGASCLLAPPAAWIGQWGNSPSASGFVSIFEGSASGWQEVERLEPTGAAPVRYFGFSLALDADRMVLTSAPNPTSSSGALTTYQRFLGGWQEVATLAPSDPSGAASFGASLELEAGELLVGQPSYASFEGLVVRFALPGPAIRFGAGLGGAAGVPTLAAEGCAAVERPFGLEVSGGVPGAPGMLLMSPTLGLSLVFGGVLWLGLPWGALLPHSLDGGGGASFPFTLDASVAGQMFFAQAGYLDASAPHGVSLTPGLGVQIR